MTVSVGGVRGRVLVRGCPTEGIDNRGPVEEPRATMVIPYVAGMSEDIRRICRGHNIRVAFRSSRTLRAMLSSVKDKVPMHREAVRRGLQDPL